MKNNKFQLTGKGSTCLVFIHGFLGSQDQWNSIIEILHPNYQILTLELPGHGNRQLNNDQPYSIEDVANQYEAVIKTIDAEEFVLVGHSMGGYVARYLSSLIPSQLQTVVLINSIAGADSLDRKESRNRSLKLIDRYKDAFINMAIGNLFNESEHNQFHDAILEMKDQAKEMSLQAVKNAIIAMRDRNSFLDVLNLSNASVHYIYSNKDSIIPADRVEDEIRFLDAHSKQIDSGHMSILTHPKIISDILKSILDHQNYSNP